MRSRKIQELRDRKMQILKNVSQIMLFNLQRHTYLFPFVSDPGSLITVSQCMYYVGVMDIMFAL